MIFAEKVIIYPNYFVYNMMIDFRCKLPNK